MSGSDDVRPTRRATAVLGPFVCLVGAVVLYWYYWFGERLMLDRHAKSPFDDWIPWFWLPWLLLLIGLVWLWRALALSVGKAALAGAGLVIAGVGWWSVNPWFGFFGPVWLIAIGFILPAFVGVMLNTSERQRMDASKRRSGR